ncbi:MAG: radical SAM protein, partial [Flavobacteriia bacterium]|nr:radical SAM protein [Flavobacteriia bacterium]
TLLGQNVDSYLWYGGGLKKDFDKASEMAKATAVSFADLLNKVAAAVPEMRIRFSTSNPQDMTDEVLHAIAQNDNVCNYIHLPFQSGSTRVLELMNRGHTREEYLDLIQRVRSIIPDCGISHDIIAGFPTETEEDHQDTLSLMKEVEFDFGYMFYYSERPNTYAARKLEDDIPEEVKKRRLREIIDLQTEIGKKRLSRFVGKEQVILVEGTSKKSENDLFGRNDQNSVVVFPREDYQPGDLVLVDVHDCTAATLLGNAKQLIRR